MVAAGLQMLGVGLCVLGWLGAIVSCALPLWRVTAFVGNNIVTAQVMWEGLWMSCVVQSTGQMQCKVYDSMLALSRDLQASRALIVVSILLATIGLLASIVGGKCTNCIIRDFYSPLVVQAQKRELGAAIFIGWGSAALLLIGGGFLCSSCPRKEEGDMGRYKLTASRSERTGYV
ncbi:claudin-like protein ZF-A9 [Megalops cyprinoides]|uniref:claudin-like protein ZF-A9 n=1 Tax=Megalops cyprinoides TaxID=118141 RepID=UPI001864B2F6|nr:claudin-like protein ZF-A9 [Megalops cyprinoides]